MTRAAFEGAPGGNGVRRGDALAAGLEREQQARLDPTVRAGRYAAQLDAAFTALADAKTKFDEPATATATAAARTIIAELARDKPAQDALQEHATRLQINPSSPLGQAIRQPDVAKALSRVIDPRAMSRGYEPGF